MTRSERERLIDRYLSGEMGSAEEHDFFIQVAVDKEMRQEFKAHRIIESALRKDRYANDLQHSGVRIRIESLLTASPVPPAARAARRRARLVEQIRQGMPPIQWMATAAAIASLIIAGLVFVPMLNVDTPPAVPAPTGNLARPDDARPGTNVEPRQISPEPAVTGRTGAAAATDGDVMESRPQMQERPAAERPRASAAADQRMDAERDRTTHTAADQPDADHARTNEAAATAPATAHRTERNTSDTLNIGIKILPPKR
jgi:hypothetical protein